MKWWGLVVLVFVFSGSVLAAEKSESSLGLKQEYKIAIIPLEVSGGRDVAKEVLPGIYHNVFEEQGFDTVMGKPVEEAMQVLNIRIGGGIPTNKELLQIGQKLQVDYILAAKIQVQTKRTWVFLVPQAKSTLTVDTVIVNVGKAEVVYDPKNLIGVSQGGSELQKAVGWLVSWPVSLFMGGSRNKEEKKAAVNTVKKVYQPFFDSFRPSPKIK